MRPRYYECSVAVCRVAPELEIGVKNGEYTFIYDYPLSKSARIKHELLGSMKPTDILLLGRKDYEAIYKEEDEAVGGPTPNAPGLLNRAKSEGPYGIWGHDITDLYFEGVSINEEEMIVTFDIGS